MTILTTPQAAQQLGITTSAVHRLVQRGTLKASRFGNSFAFDPEDVRRAKKRPRPGRPKAA